jgi:hypothetical protein
MVHPPHRGSDHDHWYKTAWGISLIGAIASVIAAIIGLIGVQLGQNTGTTPNSARPKATAAPTTDTIGDGNMGTGTTQPPPQTTSSGGSASRVLWHRRIHMPYQYGLDLDSDRPLVKEATDRLVDLSTAAWNTGNAGFQLSDARAGSVTSTKPSLSACLEALDTNALDGGGFTIRVGQAFCVETSAEQGPHLAAIRVLSWDEQSNEMDIDVTVWADTSPG